MKDTTEITLPKTDNLNFVLNLIRRYNEANRYFEAKRIVPELQKGFEEIAGLSNEALFVDADTSKSASSFLLRLKTSVFSTVNNYISVTAVGNGSEALFKVRVQPDAAVDKEEEYLLSLNSIKDAYILKPQNPDEASIIKSDIILDGLFFEKVVFDFLTAVYDARQV